MAKPEEDRGSTFAANTDAVNINVFPVGGGQQKGGWGGVGERVICDGEIFCPWTSPPTTRVGRMMLVSVHYQGAKRALPKGPKTPARDGQQSPRGIGENLDEHIAPARGNGRHRERTPGPRSEKSPKSCGEKLKLHNPPRVRVSHRRKQ